jgi:hypothetical protein
MPALIASSKLVFDEAMISVTFATDIFHSPYFLTAADQVQSTYTT